MEDANEQVLTAASTSWHSYPKIFALGHRGIAEIFHDPVVIEEKVDGSQFSFGRFGGELRCRSKGATIDVLHPEKMFRKAVEVAGSLPLVDGWTYRAEYLEKPKHNALAYDRVPKNHLMLFDVNTGHEEYVSVSAKQAEADRLGIECVARISQGGSYKDSGPGPIVAMLDRTSVLGGQKIEGLVIKNYHRFGPDKKALMGKYVSEAFKEVHKGAWRETNPETKDILQKLALKYTTPARWAKAVQHMREAGQLTDTPKDIGELIQRAQQDILDECRDEIRDVVFEWAWNKVRRQLTSGLPQWYKALLLDQQFAGPAGETAGDIQAVEPISEEDRRFGQPHHGHDVPADWS